MNEVSADEWSETKVVGKANMGENQKSSVKTIEMLTQKVSFFVYKDSI